ncbi:MAG TPA: type IV pilus assembly protein PilM [Salinisphaeraceae bacterium]|nr:type IV pilus assembly protein PilM [Salinisphaeraceae bacterium]
MGLRHKKPAVSCIGIDISSTSVKLLELEGKPNSIRVASYAREPLPDDAISDNQIINADAVGQAIARALKQSGTRNRNAAIGVSGTAVISKTLFMPVEMDEEEIEQQIMFEAPQHIPYAIDDVSLDFQILGRDPDNATRNQILLVACRRDNVDMRVAVLEIAKLKPQIVDVEEYALRNACSLLYEQMPNKGQGKTIALFDMGARQTRLNVEHDRLNVYDRVFDFGGQKLSNDLADLHDLDGVEQLHSQLRNERLKAADIAAELRMFCDEAAQQIDDALQFYFSAEAATEDIDQILLTGGCTLFPGFEAQMQDLLPWPVTCANPLQGCSNSKNAKRNQIDYDGASLMVATGLSMRSIM